ncbi:SDR family NAD(P)-dependent oxidoreductase [Marisediminicola senii]|uniref:SDR family NAD(P)-dependent oxidoreductase n=1 Tax=Marisediminicola senii TaxID=2711233 RepID=UPI0013ECA9DF|nr:SDR family NAD(P)-dependent oxidoreductase [Marisediminicola senii]
MTSLHGSVVLVVGSTGALGSLFAKALEAEGATVVGAARDATAGSVAGDLRDELAAASIVEAASEEHGRIDGVIIAAGVVAFGPVGELSDATLAELFAVNALAPIRLIRESMPHLAASATDGREPFIVTLSGVVAETPTAGLAAYSASKAALAAFTTAVSRELRRSGIRIVDARPGHTETGLTTRPIAGTAPAFPAGLEPEAVVARVIRAIVDNEKDLPSTAF